MTAQQPVTIVESGGIQVEASISPANGDIILRGQERGDGPVTLFAASEYEWFVTIPAAAKDRLALELLAALLKDNPRARATLTEWLAARNIPHESLAF